MEFIDLEVVDIEELDWAGPRVVAVFESSSLSFSFTISGMDFGFSLNLAK